MGDERKNPPADPDTPDWRPLAASECERLTRFVRILLEWDDRRRTIDAVPAVTERANGDDIRGSLTQAVLYASVSTKDQKR